MNEKAEQKIRKATIEDALFEMGIPAGVKGFTYIVDAVEYINENGMNIRITKGLYLAIAKKRNATISSVERAIRNAFDIARSEKGDYEMADHYIGFINCTNSASLMRLYLMLKREETQKGSVE